MQVLSSNAWKLVEHGFSGELKESGNILVKTSNEENGPTSKEIMNNIVLNDEIIPILKKYIPSFITSFIEDGHDNWLSELRVITVKNSNNN